MRIPAARVVWVAVAGLRNRGSSKWGRVMNPILHTTTLAVIFLTTIVPAGARETARPPDAEGQRLPSLDERPSPPSERSDLAKPPFRFRQMAGAATIRTQSRAHEWDGGSLTLNTMRAKSRPRTDGPALFNFNRFAVLATDLGVVHDLDASNSVSLGLSYAQERRRPSLIVAAHKAYKTHNTAVTLGWTHNATFRLSASLFATRFNRNRSERERMVQLAGGAPLATRGMALTASFSPTRDPDQNSYGVELRSQSLAQRDAGLIGVAAGRRDARVGIFLRQSF